MRTILHCDINNCFASIEMIRDPSLRGRPIAVCGNPAERRGIVLAKSELAKKCGVKTGDALWEAKQKCPDIIFVEPHYEMYSCYARRIRRFYELLTPRVEPFGLDECWLDMTADVHRIGLFGESLGDFVRESVKAEFGLTISVGVSFNKVFAKLGSDYKKPDGTTVFSYRDYKTRVWPISANEMLWVGRATTTKLARYGIRTIGDIANTPKSFMRSLLGKNGVQLWQNANGLDLSEVRIPAEMADRKSLGHGTTLPYDVYSSEEIWPVLLRLATRVAVGLRAEALVAKGISLYVRDSKLEFHQYFFQLSKVTDSAETLARAGFMLFCQRYGWILPVHAIGITAVHLSSVNEPRQLELFDLKHDFLSEREKQNRPIEVAISELNDGFGEELIRRATTLDVVHEHGTGFGRVAI